MDPASLALGAIAPVFGISKALRGFYKNYQEVPEGLERLTKQADVWEKIIEAAHTALQETHLDLSSSAMTRPPQSLATASDQYVLCN